MHSDFSYEDTMLDVPPKHWSSSTSHNPADHHNLHQIKPLLSPATYLAEKWGNIKYCPQSHFQHYTT
jgi:hypothetical protein